MRDADEAVSNPSTNPTFDEILARAVSRRRVLQGGLVAASAALFGPAAGLVAGRRAHAATPLFSFAGVPVSRADAVTVPDGYTAEVLYAWGDPVSEGAPFKPDATGSAEEQAAQAGMHHDGIHFFPLPAGSDSSTRGLLAVNHEYTDDGLLHPGGMEPWTADKVARSQAAHGVSVVEVALQGERWTVVRPSPYGRRITARTAMRLAGPAAGHPWLRTGAGTSRATSSDRPTGCGSTAAACCGSRPTSRPAPSTRASTPAWGTTRCWRPTRPPGRSAGS